jgi:hypothetical protein
LPVCLTINQTPYSMSTESKFLSSVGTEISREQAREMVAKYDKAYRQDKERDTKSIFYGREIIERLLKEDERVSGISFFFGCKYSEFAQKDVVQLVLVSTLEDGTLLWPDSSGKDMPVGGSADNGMACPPTCPSPQP